VGRKWDKKGRIPNIEEKRTYRILLAFDLWIVNGPTIQLHVRANSTT
jgi:hypothetical protein